MDFTITEEQELLRSSARQLMAGECPTSLVRAHMSDPDAADQLWEHLRAWLGIAGGPLVDLCLVLEETGAALAPGPFFPTAVLFAPLLAALDHPLAPLVLEGGVTGTVAMADVHGTWAPNDDPTKTFVPEAERVDHVAVVGAGPTVVVTGRLPARYVATVDTSRRLAEVDTAGAGKGVPVSADLIQDLLERAYVALAAEMLGTARWLLEATLAYAKGREQFGRPIGTFQAIQHKLANMALACERAWSAVYYAAMAIDSGDPDRHRAAHVAKAAAGAAATLAAKDGIQVHGGIGYTWEHDLHLFIRRAYASEHLLGTSGWHHDRLGELLVQPAAG
jgi:alkylation response protein AidB-like acyl-CoA dehydrogenase